MFRIKRFIRFVYMSLPVLKQQGQLCLQHQTQPDLKISQTGFTAGDCGEEGTKTQSNTASLLRFLLTLTLQPINLLC